MRRFSVLAVIALFIFGTKGEDINPGLPSVSSQKKSVPVDTSQQKKSAKGEQKEEQDTAESVEREIQHALQSLYLAFDSAKNLPDPVSRIRSYIALAELLWHHDRPFPTNLFRLAVEETKKVERPTGTRVDESQSAEELRRLILAKSAEELRRLILAKVVPLDYEFALELSRSFRSQDRNGQQSRSESDQLPGPSKRSEESHTLLRLADSLLARDPHSASSAAAATLSEGVSVSFLLFLQKLRQVDQSVADQLYDRALRATLRNNPPSIDELVLLGNYSLPGILPMTVKLGGEPPAVEPARAAQYLKTLVEAVARHVERGIASSPPQPGMFGSTVSLYHLLMTIRPTVAQYIPDLSPVLDGLLGQLSLHLSQRQREDLHREESKRTATLEEKISDHLYQADQTRDPEERDLLLFRALQQAVQANMFDTAFRILPKMNDIKLRAETSDYVHYSRIKKALEQNDVETARRSASELNNVERATLAQSAIAKKLVEQKENDAAIAALIQAEARVKQLPTSTEKVRSLVHIADALARIDTDRAFSVLHAAVSILNQSEITLEGPSGANFLFKMKKFISAWEIAEDDLIPTLGTLITTLSKADPIQGQKLVLSLEKPLLRVLAQIAFAQSQLDHAKEKKAKLTRSKG